MYKNSFVLFKKIKTENGNKKIEENYSVCLLVSQVDVKSITADTRNFHEGQWKLLGYLQVPDASLLVLITADRSLAKTR